MPCYNAAAMLPEALRSLAEQTFPDYEIVAVDDGSTDATAALLNQAAARDTRIRVIHQEHSGIVAALQRGLAACRAPLVARMDADDIAHPDRLARQVAFLDAHPEIAVLGCRVEAFPADRVREGFRVYLDWQNRLLTDADIRREMFIESPFAHPSVMFCREVVLAVGGYQDRGWAEDYDLWLRLYLTDARFAKLPDVLLYWRDHPARLTRVDPRNSLENFLRAKAYYLIRGLLHDRDAVIVWGAGMIGRRLSKHLQRAGAPLRAFLDVDPRKIGRTKRGLPIYAPDDLPRLWAQARRPVLLAAVGARGARALIRQYLTALELVEGVDWWCVA